jgi:hypothetical protein
MKRVHFIVGLLVIIVFLITGQYMRHRFPSVEALAELSDGKRLLFRSRHIYILWSGLLNLALGLYMNDRGTGWRRIIRSIGSCFVALAPIPLVAAFAYEPGQEDLTAPISHIGLYTVFAGMM